MSTAQVVVSRSAVGERRREAKPWALAILCVLIPILPAYVVPGGPLKSNGAPAKVLALWLFGLVVLGFVAGRRTGRERRINPGVAVLLVYFFAWLWIYGLGRLHIDDPLLEAAKSRAVIALIANIGAALYVFARIKTIRDRDFVLGALLIGLAFECAVGLLQGVASVDLRFLFQPPGFVVNTTDLTLDERIGAKRVIGTAQHAIEFSVLAVAAVPLGVYFARNARRGEVRVLAAVAALLGLAAMPAAVSRSGVISLVVALLVYMFYFRVRTIAIAATALVLAVVGYIAIFPTVVNALWGTITGSADDPSIKHRTEDYAGVSRIFHDHPYFGLGLGGQPHLLDNEWLQTVVQGGIFGIAAMIVLSGGALFGVSGGLRAARTRREREQAFMLGAVVAAILVSSTTFDLFYYQQATLIFFITFALLWSTYSIPAQGGGGLGRSRFRRDPPPGGLPATNGRAESHAPEPKPPAAENAPAVTEPEPPAAVQGPPVADTESLAASLEPPATDAESPAVGKGLSSGVRWTSVSMVGREIARTGFTVLLARLIGPDAFGIVAQATVYLGILSLLLDQGFASALIQRPTLDRYMPGATMTVNIGVGAVLAAVTIGIAAGVGGVHAHPGPEMGADRAGPQPDRPGRGDHAPGNAVARDGVPQERHRRHHLRAARRRGRIGRRAGGRHLLGPGGPAGHHRSRHHSRPDRGRGLLAEPAPEPPARNRGLLLACLRRRGPGQLPGPQCRQPAHRQIPRRASPRLLCPGLPAAATAGSADRPEHRLGPVPVVRAPRRQPSRPPRRTGPGDPNHGPGGPPRHGPGLDRRPQLIQLVFGSAWAPAIPIVRVLAMAGALPAVYQPSTIPVMLGLGHAKLQLRYAVLCTAVSIGGIVAGLPFGPFGVAVGYSAATVALLPVEWVVRRRCVGVSLRTQFTQLLPGLHIAFWMAAAYASIALILPGHDFVILCAGTAVALAVGAVVLRLAYRTQLDEILHLVRRVAGKRGNDTEPAPEPPAARTADPSGTRSP